MTDIEKIMETLDRHQPLWYTKYATQTELAEFVEDTTSKFNTTIERKAMGINKSLERLRWQVARRIWPIANATYETFSDNFPKNSS